MSVVDSAPGGDSDGSEAAYDAGSYYDESRYVADYD